MGAGRPLADWRAGAHYETLAKCGRQGFAWEWLRRSPAYASAAKAAAHLRPDMSIFGLHRFEPIELAVPYARPIWRGDVDPYVLRAVAAPARNRDDAFDFAAIEALETCTLGAGGAEHWLWSDGVRHVRVDVTGHSLRGGPVVLDWRIAGVAQALSQAAALTRFVSLARTGRFVPKLFVPERRAARWALVLRTHDALAAGATQREIAEHLFGIGAVARWRIVAASDRERVRRLVTAARIAAGVDPRRWLDGSFP